MECVLVSHFHWDREWYRTFQAYRARLVDAVDRVLDLLAADPGYRFLLDGQTVLLEDYLAIRPQRRAELEAWAAQRALGGGTVVRAARLAAAVGRSARAQPVAGTARRRAVRSGIADRLRARLVRPSGPAAADPRRLRHHDVHPLARQRRRARLRSSSPYRWEAPDGSAVEATLLREGYFNAACLPEDAAAAARGLAALAERLVAAHDGPALLMNGVDHMLPDAHTGAVAQALAELTGGRVQRGLLEDAVGRGRGERRRFRGELVGARIAPLLPGVWSTRTPTKLANRRCETLLEGWAEPWAALGRRLSAQIADERPALRLAWQGVLQNQAHDSICGCSFDAVDTAVRARFDEAEGLASQTVARVLERLAGLDSERRVPWSLEQEVVVFNPSPQRRTDVVRIPLDAFPAMRMPLSIPEFAPLSLAAMASPGFTLDGQPVRVVAAEATRTRWLPGEQPFDVELVAADVPAFGCRRYRLTPSDPVADVVDDGRVIEAGDVRVAVDDDGTLRVRFGEREYRGLVAIEDSGDRGDSYDFDPVDE